MAPKIIIAEDNDGIRAVVRMTLEMGDYEIIETDNGQKAFDALKANPDCALLITDLAMPVMDGFELLSKIRHELNNKALPIFVISAEKDATGAFDHGATRVIRKPFSPIELLDAVKRAIQPEQA